MKLVAKIFICICYFYAVAILATTPTKIMIYKAYIHENVLNPNLLVAQRYTGICWARSLANPSRLDAWQCKASNLVLDPCYEDGDSLACVVTPWSHKAALLELGQPLAKRSINQIDTQKAQPWAFELANGQRCAFLTGASVVINNIRANYTCQSSNFGILGEVDRTSPEWTVNLYDFKNNSVSKVAVTIVWF